MDRVNLAVKLALFADHWSPRVVGELNGQPDPLSALDANLEGFPAGTAQVLEYWLDVSRFSHWRRPAIELPWWRDVLEADLETYAAWGIQHVTSFAVYVDAEYRERYGEPPFIREYGEALMGRRSTR